MSVLRVKDKDGNWQLIKTIKGDIGPQGPQGPKGDPGDVSHEEFDVVANMVELHEHDIITNSNRISRIESDLFDSGETNGKTITLEDSTFAEAIETKIDGEFEQGLLPKEYQQVEYIESTGTQYIDTPIIVNENVEIEFKIQPTQHTDTRNGTSYCNIFTNSGVVSITGLNNNVIFSEYYTYTDKKYKIKISSKDNAVYVNNVKYSYDIKNDFKNQNAVFGISKRSDATFFGGGQKIFYFIGDDGIHNVNLIPCYRKSDNVIGLYDLVENKFYTNKGTGTFLKGNDIPNPDTPQEIKVIEDNFDLVSCSKNILDTSILNGVNADRTYNGYGFWAYKITNEVGDYTLSRKDNSMVSSASYVAIGQGKDLATAYANKIWLVHPSISSLNARYRTINNTGELWLFTGNTDSLIQNTLKICVFLQLEKGTVPTEYEQYQGTTINIDLKDEFVGKIDDNVKDTLRIAFNEEDGRNHLYLDKMVGKIVLDGNGHWSFDITRDITQVFRLDYKNPTTILVCDRFVANNPGDTEKVVLSHELYIGINKTRAANLDQFKQWLSQNNTTIYHALLTPYTVDLGTIDQLLTYYPITNIYTTHELQPMINVRYYRDIRETINNKLNRSEFEDFKLTYNSDKEELDSRVSKNEKDIATNRTDIDKLISIVPKKTATGTNELSYNNALEYKLFDAEYQGNAEQFTTTGKQLFDFTKINRVGGGTNDNGVITTTETSAATLHNLNIFFSNDAITIPANTKVYFSADIKLNNGSSGTFSTFNDGVHGGATKIKSPTLNTTKQRYQTSLTFSSETNISAMLIQFTNLLGSVEVSNIMISTSSDENFEPYTNGASPNPDYPQDIKTLKGFNDEEITIDGKVYGAYNCLGVKRTGKNLFNKDDSIVKGKHFETDGSITNYDTDFYQEKYIFVKSNANLIIKTSFGGWVRVIEYDKNFNVIASHIPIDPTGKFKTNINCKYVRIGGGTQQLDDLQLEYGDVRTSYEPYQERIDYIDLQGNELLSTDKIQIDDKGNVKLIKEWGKVVLEGTEDVRRSSAYSTETYFVFSINEYNKFIKPAGKLLCDYFINDNAIGATIINKEGISFLDANYGMRFSILNTTANTIEQAKQWLSQNKPIVYYQLATPQTIDLGQVNIESLEDINNVTLLATLEPTSMKETHACDLQKEIEEIKNALLSTGANL